MARNPKGATDQRLVEVEAAVGAARAPVAVLPDIGILQLQMAAMLDIPWDVVTMLCEWGPDDPRTQHEVDALLDARFAAADSLPTRGGGLQMSADELAALLQLTPDQGKLLNTLVRQADVTITCAS